MLQEIKCELKLFGCVWFEVDKCTFLWTEIHHKHSDMFNYTVALMLVIFLIRTKKIGKRAII